MSKKLTYEYVKSFIEEQGYQLLSTEYKNAQTKLKLQCPEGHIYNTKYYNFYMGKRCPVCYGNKKKIIEEVKEYIESYNYKLLSTEYKNVHNYIKIKCPEGHIYNATYNYFQQGNRCPICYNNKRGKSQKLLFKKVKNYIEEQGYQLLSTKYINVREKLKIQCPKNHIYFVNYNKFQQGRRCPICSCKIKKTLEEIKEYIESFDYKLLSKEYKNNSTKLSLQCPAGHKYEVT